MCQLSPKAWLIQSEVEIWGFGVVPCNNLLLVGSGQSVLLDVLTTDALTEKVLDWAAAELRCPVRHLIVTHAHDDRIGGIAAAHRRNIMSYALPLTCSLARRRGYQVPRKEIPADVSLTLADMRLDCLFPGHGHSPDNLVIWIPAESVLYGGCILKEAASRSIGNIADADLHSWEDALRLLLKRYSKAQIVVPGHGSPGDLRLIEHTISLIHDENQKAKPL